MFNTCLLISRRYTHTKQSKKNNIQILPQNKCKGLNSAFITLSIHSSHRHTQNLNQPKCIKTSQITLSSCTTHIKILSFTPIHDQKNNNNTLKNNTHSSQKHTQTNKKSKHTHTHYRNKPFFRPKKWLQHHEIPKWSPTLVLNWPNKLDFAIRKGMRYSMIGMAESSDVIK